MKNKITYLLFMLPFLTFAQGPWNFDTGTELFTGSFGNVVTQSSGNLINTFTAGTQNPMISSPTEITLAPNGANVNADVNNYLEIRLKNTGLASHIRLTGSSSLGGSANNKGFYITPNSDFKTYFLDITSWSGTITQFSMALKTATGPGETTNINGTAYIPADGDNIEIDYIRFVSTVTTAEKNSFDFNTSTDGFTTLIRTTAVQTTETGNGVLQINVTGANQANGKVVLNPTAFHVNGTNNKYAHVIIKNTSTNNEFIMNGLSGAVNMGYSPAQNFTTADTGYKTYDFDLSTWDDSDQQPELTFGVKATWSGAATYAINDIVISSNSYFKNTTGANDALLSPNSDPTNWVVVNATGDTDPLNGAIVGGALDRVNPIYVDSVIFDNVTLGTNNFELKSNTISLYPNPANEVLNISSINTIEKIEVYDVLGKMVLSNNKTSVINLQILERGIYLVKVNLENGSVAAKKFVKE